MFVLVLQSMFVLGTKVVFQAIHSMRGIVTLGTIYQSQPLTFPLMPVQTLGVAKSLPTGRTSMQSCGNMVRCLGEHSSPSRSQAFSRANRQVMSPINRGATLEMA